MFADIIKLPDVVGSDWSYHINRENISYYISSVRDLRIVVYFKVSQGANNDMRFATIEAFNQAMSLFDNGNGGKA